MRPTNAARRADYDIGTIPHREARAFISEHHYAKGASNTSVLSMGMSRGNLGLCGAAIWIPPTKNCALSVSSDWMRVLSLSRLAILPGEPTNTASMLISACIRHIRKEGKWTSLVTFEDSRMGHDGAIYFATNWTCVGETRGQPAWVDFTGRQVSRLATTSRTAEEMRSLGYRMQGMYTKIKFVMHLASKRGGR